MNSVIYYPQISDIIYVFKTCFIILAAYCTCLKITKNEGVKLNLVIVILAIIISSIFNGFIKNTFNYSTSIIFLILTLSFAYSISTKQSIGYSITISTISLSINYMIYFFSLLISFMPVELFGIVSDYISLIIIIFIHIVLLVLFFKLKRIKNGISFIKNKIDNDYFDVLTLNISIIIVLITSIINNLYYINKILVYNLSFSMTVFSIMMVVTIQKTLTMYYKHKKLIEELNETKEELENTKKDRDKVEQENIEISKTNHSISHKIKSLNRKIDKLMMNSEIANEIDLKDRINEISKEYNKEKVTVELSKTGIEIVDDMLDCMKEECIKNNIEFELQLSGNIHHMTNNYIPKEELEILLADHIKDAIIALKHTDNINRSILVRLGLIDEFYSLYIYDSGIEFEIDTLVNLGTKPITTHKEDGGTGMGFLNTFDTLNKHKASMVIDEIGKPSKDNYTKVIIIKFDNKNEFKIKSYRTQEIEQKGINNNMQIDIK